MALEYRLAKLVHFALHQYVGAGAFEGKVETADAGEERDHADGRLAASDWNALLVGGDADVDGQIK